MSYTVLLTKPAIKSLDGMDRATERRIRTRLRAFADNPYYPRLSKPLVGVGSIRSARVGDWRILFATDENEEAIVVLAVRPRGEAYRDL
ncbi:Plasmid stabilization system [mine drainage metagenome]|uniref:Plasmid stabilization system n=1 Tax=mine drainage metagenome TaxID=410659 RepID=T0YG02_9ZZZZ